MSAPVKVPGTGNAEGWRNDIAGLRGLAVLLVVAYHLQLRGAGGGFIGVDVFFVLSGYLMTRIVWGGLERGDFSFWRFVVDRAVRIWPALGTMVALLLLLGAWLLPPDDLAVLAQQSVQAVLFWSNQFFHDHFGYDTRTADSHWLLHTWSLSVEWQFYLLYPLGLMLAARAGATRRVALVVVGVLLVGSFICHAMWTAARPSSAFFLLPGRAWELLAGGLAYFLSTHGMRGPARSRRWWAWAGIALVLAGALWLALRRVPAVGAGWPLVLPVLGTAFVLWAGVGDQPLLSMRPLQALGRWSYSIYLWHWPLIVGTRMTDAFLDHPVLAAVGVAVMSVVCGALSYRFVERVRGRGRLRLGKPAVALAAAAALAVVTVWSAGWAMRGEAIPSRAAYLASVRALYYPDRCSNFMKTVQETRPCTLDKGSARRILVIGDSHAEQLYPWFAAHSTLSVDFYTQAECPPVPRFDRMQNGFHCRDYAEAAWRRAAGEEYDTVVLAAYWPNIGLNGAPYCHAAAHGSGCVMTQGEAKQALIRGELKSAIEGLVARGKTVVMLAPTPESRVRVPERIARERFWFGEVRLKIDERSIAAQAGWLTPLFDELKRVSGFHLVSLNDRLCAAGVCKAYDTELKRPVYIDETHFDPVWMERNGAVLAPYTRAR